jgi:hypothetical protein
MADVVAEITDFSREWGWCFSERPFNFPPVWGAVHTSLALPPTLVTRGTDQPLAGGEQPTLQAVAGFARRRQA